MLSPLISNASMAPAASKTTHHALADSRHGAVLLQGHGERGRQLVEVDVSWDWNLNLHRDALRSCSPPDGLREVAEIHVTGVGVPEERALGGGLHRLAQEGEEAEEAALA
jgi:hypothetical protein